MPFIPKMPEACRNLDRNLVRGTLTRHRLDICAAAKELGVKRTDLCRLTWHDPKLLDEARDVCDVYLHRCRSLLMSALRSPRARKREWAAERILGSSLFGAQPLSPLLQPAPRRKGPTHMSPLLVEMYRRRALKKAERDRANP
jgi:hypothetical protein